MVRIGGLQQKARKERAMDLQTAMSVIGAVILSALVAKSKEKPKDPPEQKPPSKEHQP